MKLQCIILCTIMVCYAGASAAIVTIDSDNNILVDGKYFIPIMQWLQPAGSIDKNKNIGINTFTGIWEQTTQNAIVYLDACNGKGAWAVISFDSTATIKNHASLLGWIFGDEPDLESNKILPSKILSDYALIKQIDKNHLTFLTLTGGFFSDMPKWMNGDDSYYYKYCEATDLVGFDKYPIYGWCRKDWFYWVGDAQDSLRVKYAKEKHPTYQWIECMTCCSKWCSYTERQNKGPYPNEVRAEVWYALIHGAKAIGYFTHSWRSNDCQQVGDAYYANYQLTADHEKELTRTNRQVTALTNVLCQKSTNIVTYKVSSGTGRVDVTSKAYNGVLYIFAVNVLHSSSNNIKTVQFTVPGLAQTGKSVEVYEESRTIQPAVDIFTDTFTEQEPVHIYTIQGAVQGILPPDHHSFADNKYKLRQVSQLSFIEYFLSARETISISLYSASGRLIQMLYEGRQDCGVHTISLSSRGYVPSGIYLCVLKGNAGSSTVILACMR